MDRSELTKISDYAWRIEPVGNMRVPAIIYANAALIDDMDDMDDKVREQIVNVTTLPGIVSAAYAMPDAHWGMGSPLAASQPLRRKRAASSAPEAWVSTFIAVCA